VHGLHNGFRTVLQMVAIRRLELTFWTAVRSLDHVVVFGERHLRHLLRSYATYEARTHLLVNKDAPSPRTVHAVGRILFTPFLGGLHHLYVRD
jgi:hypothetical protein